MSDGTDEYYLAPNDIRPSDSVLLPTEATSTNDVQMEPVEVDEHGVPVGMLVSDPFEEPEPYTITEEQKKLMDEDPFSPAKLIQDGKYVAPTQDEELYSPQDQNDLGAALFSLINRATEHTEDPYIVDNAGHVRDLLVKATTPPPIVDENMADTLIDINDKLPGAGNV